MLKLFLLFVVLLFDQDTSLVEQHNVQAYLYDLDSYVHGLSPEKRYGFAEDKVQIEKNILTILNMNFVYDYITQNKLDEDQAFVNGKIAIDELDLDIDQNFIGTLNLDHAVFEKHLKHFLLKKEFFARMRYWLKDEARQSLEKDFAYDYFLAHRSQYEVPEKRHLGMITLDQAQTSSDEAIALLERLLDGASFSKMAVQHSIDQSVNLNLGDIKTYSEKQFKYPFSDKVFASDVGIIPTLFSYDDKYYLVEVKKIIPKRGADFKDHKDRIIDELVEEVAQEKMQTIIDSYVSADSISMNKDAIEMVMDRYLVFEKDK